jgi:hypothetical protein
MITSIQVGSLTINGDAHYPLTRAPGLGLSDIRHASYEFAGIHGGRFVSAFYSPRRFSLEGMIIGDSVDDFAERRDAFHEAFDVQNGEQTFTFTLSTGRVLTLRAVLVAPIDDPLVPGWPNAAEFHAELEAAFPFFLGATGSTQTTGLATGGGGGTVPATVPMSLTQGSGGVIYVSNGGNALSWPTVRITGPVTNPTIRNHVTGEELRLAITLGSGEFVDVTFQQGNKTVIDHTGRNRYDAVTGDWWVLEPGTTEIRFLADSGSGTLSITTYDSYLAI